MKETWKDAPEYKGFYQVSNNGRVKALERVRDGELTYKEKIMKPTILTTGYASVGLFKNGMRTRFSVHRLVATCFIENPSKKPQVNHKNGNRSDNRVDNLEWCTASENHLHSFRELGRKVWNKGIYLKKQGLLTTA